MLSKTVSILYALTMLLWPLLVCAGLYYEQERLLGIALLLVLALRLVLMRRPASAPAAAADAVATAAAVGTEHQRSPFIRTGLAALSAAVMLCLLTIWFKDGTAMLYYPVGVNLIFLTFFLWSLRTVPVVELLARLQLKLRQQRITPAIKAYTRTVTKIWCGFFIINGGIALYTVLKADLALWTLYNGLISYLAMGTLFGSEYLIRRHLEKTVLRPEPAGPTGAAGAPEPRNSPDVAVLAPASASTPASDTQNSTLPSNASGAAITGGQNSGVKLKDTGADSKG